MKLHAEILKKNGKNEFAILPYEEFVALTEFLEDIEDLRDLEAAIAENAGQPTISLEAVRKELRVHLSLKDVVGSNLLRASEMTLILELPKEEEERLTAKARAAGLDVKEYVQRIVRVAAISPPIRETLQPIRDAFRASGMTKDELGDLLERPKHEMRTE